MTRTGFALAKAAPRNYNEPMPEPDTVAAIGTRIGWKADA